MLVGDLDGVFDAVMKRVRAGGAERRLEGIENQVHGRRSRAVDRDLPAGGVSPADRGREGGRLPVEGSTQPMVEMDLQSLDPQPFVDGAGHA